MPQGARQALTAVRTEGPGRSATDSLSPSVAKSESQGANPHQGHDAPPDPGEPPPHRDHEEKDGARDGGREKHLAGEEAEGLGAHVDPVPDEDEGVEGLHPDHEGEDRGDAGDRTGVVREEAREPGGEEEEHCGQDHSREGTPPEETVPDPPEGGPVPLAPVAPHEGLGGDREGVDDEGEEEPELDGDLVGRDLGGPDPGGDRGGEGEGADQGEGAHAQRPPDPEKGEELGRPGEAGGLPEDGPVGSEEEPDEGEGPEPLGHDRGPRRALEPPTEAEDEEGIEDEVHEVQPESDPERGAGVLETPEDPVARHHDKDRGPGQRPDPEVGESWLAELPRRTHEVHEEPAPGKEEGRREDADPDREGEGLDDRLPGRLPVAGGPRPGNPRRRSVREKVEDDEGHREDRGVHPEGGQGDDPETPDEGGVDHRDERVGCEGSERRYGERGDLPIDPAVGKSSPPRMVLPHEAAGMGVVRAGSGCLSSSRRPPAKAALTGPAARPTPLIRPSSGEAPHMQTIVIRLFVNAVALWVAARLVGGIELREEFWPVLLVAAVFGVVNALIKPFVLLLSLPFLILTLGLFTIVVNALMLMLTGALVGAFSVDGFWPALWGSLLISIVSFLFSMVLPDGSAS